ncbi:proteasome subunit beta type-3 [Salpingoeca rosetta]|uniref:Proteasome subunit beta n=1 Tax=Salpingoeca rosetta (strain ATCC 50818 / BSB-021) TaxID=946362 RepID=F2TVC7_SALR5|nr:proteasome subunit beta type-3 [Salpingoeca rosetta]EGD72023.1 proteasome subunit beta type-3 [Salpingoeca rosetta]|eukprot:XP_004998595.1 proteasome subunit beta type-3 [Salpingoeca rosetta]
MSIMEYNGSAVVAMTGKECVAIAADRRLGAQAQTVSTDFQKVFQMGPKLFVGLPGLGTDAITVSQRLKFRLNMYTLREERDIEPKTMINLVSSFLYERRFGPYFVEPVVAGLDSKNQPYVASTDLIGCPMETSDFVVGGTSSEQLYGMCESLYKPDMAPDDLFETISQALMNAVDRDCLAGWGAIVHIIEKDKITTRELKARMD